MKKIEYLAPESKVLKLNLNKTILSGSPVTGGGESPEPGGEIPGAGPDE